MTYTSADFDRHRIVDYTLLGWIEQETHTIAIVDHERQLKFIANYDPANADQQVSDILNLNFERVKLAVPHGGYLFVPMDVFDERYLPTYLHYLPDDGLGDPTVSNIPSMGVSLICKANRFGLDFFLKRFPQMGVYAAVQALLHGIAGYGRRLSGLTLVIDKQSSSVSMYLFNTGEFIYGGEFEVYNADDLNYYLLTVLEHVGLEDKKLRIRLSGNIAVDDDYFRKISKYAEQVVFADAGWLTGIRIPQELLPHQHRFLTLFGLNLCE